MPNSKPSKEVSDSSLSKAVAAGDFSRVRERIAAGADVNTCAKAEAPPLFTAAARGNIEIARELVKAGADVNRVFQPKYASLRTSPLCLAIENGHWEVSQLLVKAGAKVDLEPNRGENAAGVAAHQAIKAFQEANEEGMGLFDRHRRRKNRKKTNDNCDHWLQFVREAIADGVKIRDYWLWAAAGTGFKELVQMLIAAGTNVNAAPHRSRALDKAIEKGHEEIALALIRAGAELKPLGESDPGPLILAAAMDRIEIVSALLNAGADINQLGTIRVGEYGQAEVDEHTDAKGKVTSRSTHYPDPPIAESSTALIIAVRRGCRELARLLIDRGADLSLCDAQGRNALGWAIQLEHQAIADLLRESGAKEPEYKEGSAMAALLAAANTGNVRQIESILDLGANPNKPMKNREGTHLPLVAAVRGGHEKAVMALLARGADPNATAVEEFTADITPLMAAAESGSVEIAKLLLDAGAKWDAKDRGYDGAGGQTALHYAARSGHARVIELLVSAGAKINGKAKGGGTPLMEAVGEKKKEASEALLKLRADPNTGPRDGAGPLYMAASNHDRDLVKLLLAHGAKPGSSDKKSSFLPLAAAAGEGSVEIVRLLLEAGAPINAAGDQGWTALFDAALLGHEDVVEILLGAGADPNFKTDDGFTALMAAVRSGKPSIVKLLLEAGSRINDSNRDGETATDMAKQGWHRSVIAQVETSGGKKGVELPKKSIRGKAAPTSASEEESEPPDFSEAGKRPEFKAIVAEIEKLCGTNGEPLENIAGGFSFTTSSSIAKRVLEEQHARLLDRNAYLFQLDWNHAGENDELALLPTREWADLIRAFQTNGANSGLMPSDIIVWLVTLSKDHPFVLTGFGWDWLEGRFLQPVKDSRKVARKMYEFCSDIVDQGVGSVKELAQELEKNGRIFFWWD